MRRLWSPRRLRRKLTLRRWMLAKTDAGQVQFDANDPQLGSLTWQSSWQPVAPRRGWPLVSTVRWASTGGCTHEGEGGKKRNEEDSEAHVWCSL